MLDFSKKNGVAFLFIIASIFSYSFGFSQSDNLNEKVDAIQVDIERAEFRLIQLKSQNSSDPIRLRYIQNIENARMDLIIKKTTLEYSLSSTNNKLKVKKIDFDTFPENKQLEITANPGKFEILN
jgi:hypothetical protein